MLLDEIIATLRRSFCARHRLIPTSCADCERAARAADTIAELGDELARLRALEGAVRECLGAPTAELAIERLGDLRTMVAARSPSRP